MRRYFSFSVAAALAFVLLAAPARAQISNEFEEEIPISEEAPSIEEYNNVPPGLMMPSDEKPKEVEKKPVVPVPDGKVPLLGTRHNFQTAQKLYNQGKYAEIIESLELLSTGDNTEAKELLGIMHRQGQGLEKNPAKAFELLTVAADMNRPLAQHHLGIMHYLGEGLEVDKVTALMWLHIAIAHYSAGAEEDRARQDRDNVSRELSRRERDIALQKARAWLTKKGEAHLLEEP